VASAPASAQGVVASRAASGRSDRGAGAALGAGAGALAAPRRGASGLERRATGEPPVRRYRTERRSPGRSTVLVVVGLIVAVAVIVAVVLSLGGGKGASSSSSEAGGGAGNGATQTSAQGTSGTERSSNAGSGATTSAGQLNVVVLNGTTTTGLAHRVAGELQQHGYTRASALGGQPPGANQATVVEYASGHRSDAQRVARSLGVTQAQPVEGTVASMAGSASIVVIVGLDKA
jgi:hypothetical protein